MKTFIITVSKTFPATHKRKGEGTYFSELIKSTIGVVPFSKVFIHKIHTIRANYPFWKKRIDQVQAGEAILSIRYWSGKPYNSKQVEICKLGKNDGVGVQMLEFTSLRFMSRPVIDGIMNTYFDSVCKNDGLSLVDFIEWFKNYDLSEQMAIIHFTKFRY